MPTLGRPRAFDRDQALRAAMLVFWHKGFLATSMNDLCDAMRICSPSLYAAFGSKEDLYLEAVEHYAQLVQPLVWRHLADAPTARAGIEAFLLAATRDLPGLEEAPGGCMVTLGAISDECPAAVANAAKQARIDSLDLVRARLSAAVAQGELAPSTDIDRLSHFYLGVFQGIALQARDGVGQDQLEGIVAMAMIAWPGA